MARGGPSTKFARSERSISNGDMTFIPSGMQTFGILTLLTVAAATSCVTTT